MRKFWPILITDMFLFNVTDADKQLTNELHRFVVKVSDISVNEYSSHVI